MENYTAIIDFSLPQVGLPIHIGDTLGKIASRISVLIDGTEYENQALWDWLGTVPSLTCVAFSGAATDPLLPGMPNIQAGTQAITSGLDVVTVTGLSLGLAPTSITVTVNKPAASDDNLFATVRADSITADGFTADLSSAASKVGYFLSYSVLPASGSLINPSWLLGGSVAIGSGARTVTVSALFAAVPTKIVVSVTKPNGSGSNIFATVKEDSITATGFIVDLSAMTNSTGYMLNYFVG